MEFDQIVDYIVQEVLKKLENVEQSKKNIKKTALVVINGGTVNLEQVILELEKISKDYQMETIFSEAAKDVVGLKKFELFNIREDINMMNLNEILNKKDIVIIPLLTKNTCAKVAVGIRDNVITYLISKAILMKKNIVAVYDSCIVDNETEYGKQLNLNIKKLQSYGINFVKSTQLANYILSEQGKEVIKLKGKKIITADDIFGMRDKKIVISENSIITTLAKEKAEEENISFEVER